MQSTFRTGKFPKIRRQIIFIFFWAAIFPVIIINFFSVIQIKNQMYNQYESQLNADALRVNSILFDITTSIYTSCDTVISYRESMDLFGSDELNKRDMQAYSHICDALDVLYDNMASISSIQVYTDNPLLPSSERISYVSDHYASQDWYQNISPDTWDNWICLPDSKDTDTSTYRLALVRRIASVSPDYSAYLVVYVDQNYLKNRIEKSDYQIIASLDDNTSFYSSNQALIQTDFPFPEDFSSRYCNYAGSLEINGKNVLSHISSFEAYKTNNYFYICSSDPDAYESIRHSILIYNLMAVIVTLVPFIIILAFSRYFSNRVISLKYSMHEAKLGNYDNMISFQGDDELKDTFQDLISMVSTIREKDAKYYNAILTEQQLINQQQQMEFKNLANQINPHFLYNTLLTIQMQALASNDRDVANSIKLLGKCMHYVLENTGTNSTTLAKELEYTQAYLSIQQIRFEDRIQYSIEIAPEIEASSCEILPLLLQPIVENAISHGLADISEGGKISISATLEGRDLILSVSDNGCGMEEDTLKQLILSLNREEKNGTDSIGLYNINQRLRLFYGQRYFLKIESTPGNGTTATIRLPYTAVRN